MKRDSAIDSPAAHGRRLRLIRLAHMKGEDNQAKWCRTIKIDPAAWNNAETGDNYLGRTSAAKIRASLGIGFDDIFFGDLRALPDEYADRIATIEAKERAISKKG